MSEIITAPVDARDALIAQLRRENELLQRKVNNQKDKLAECREKKALVQTSRMTINTVQAVANAIDDNNEQWAETLAEQADFWFYALIVELLLRDVDTDAALYSGEELRARVNEATAGDLMNYLRRAKMLIDNQSMPEIEARVLAHDRAIHELVNKRDDGTMLRGLAKAEQGAARRIVEWREKYMAGRPTGANEVTRAIGEYAVEHAKEWGAQWELIGKRHLAHLESLERPTLLDRKVIAKYKDGNGYLDRMGEWHGKPKHLHNTVRNAYRAVGGK